jgi:adenine-specific DNA-methyltransferase
MILEFSELRDRCGLELNDVAREFGEPLNAVICWENGESLPPDRVLRSLAIMADFSPFKLKAMEKSIRVESELSPLVSSTLKKRKSQLGQFLTPPSIANFMASMFSAPHSDSARLLDAGAGQGALTKAFIEHSQKIAGAYRIEATAFEFDEEILPKLRDQLAMLREHTGSKCSLVEGDFIKEATIQICSGRGPLYSHAILNPPYKKISSGSDYRSMLRAAGLETVNLYTGFVGLSLELLESGGELVAIIPRSFCNGPYYQPFRRFILKRASIQAIHLFNSRNKAFKDDGVLQENVILKLVRGGEQGNVVISTSQDDSFADFEEKKYAFERIVFSDDADQFIHIPTGNDEQILESGNFNYNLSDLGLTVSTGPVVDFRLKSDLRSEPESDTVPLLYPGHFDEKGLQWPKIGFKKPNAIRDTVTTRKWLYQNGFYAVVRRFSSKEERRRIVANVVDPSRLPSSMIGFENHLNVFHTNRQPISEDLAHGLSTYLNATAVDTYFRRFNGHTQVNATDLRAMRYPRKDKLITLGHWAKNQAYLSQDQIDEKVNAL